MIEMVEKSVVILCVRTYKSTLKFGKVRSRSSEGLNRRRVEQRKKLHESLNRGKSFTNRLPICFDPMKWNSEPRESKEEPRLQ